MQFYSCSIEETRKQLGSGERGLSSREAQNRLRKYGKNIIPERKATPWYGVLGRQFVDPLIIILVISVFLTVIFKELKDAAVILAVVLTNAFVGFFQEINAERSIRALAKMLVPKTLVLRDGDQVEVPVSDVVPGDVVLLSSGMRVPADLRIVEVLDAWVDESPLTGESVPVSKHIRALQQEHLAPAEQSNMAFTGTTLVRGRLTGIVTATGTDTVLGGIADEVATLETAKTPLQMKIERFTKYVAIAVILGIAVIFLIGIIRGISAELLFYEAIALAVVAIPESLPIIVTVAMAVGVKRMASKKTIVRTLPSVETLGSTSVICSDKTGTITLNEMTVERLFDGDSEYAVEGRGYGIKGAVLRNGERVKQARDGLRMMLRIGILCNEADLTIIDGISRISGDPTEAALLVVAEKAGISEERTRHDCPRRAILPFESGRNFMATVNEIDGTMYLLVKGSPEALAGRCTCAERGTVQKTIEKANEYAAEGLRVLAFAWKKLDKVPYTLTETDVAGLTLAGLQCMIDPPRPDVYKSIRRCQEAGIRVIIITGDHAITAKAIAGKIGIDTGAGVITGADLNDMSLKELREVVKKTTVFARVSPENKMMIVHQLMQDGEIVAVTGDGVNDAPMLRAAHLGVAMGKTGTDVARESANMVLQNDSFTAIVDAIYEGRVVFENIRKSIAFLIPTGLAGMATIFFALILGIPSPYHPAQLLWINLVTNGIQVLALAFEPGDKNILRKRPRKLDEEIMGKDQIRRTILVAGTITIGVMGVYLTLLQSGAAVETARTIAVTTMVFFQFFQLLNARSETQSLLAMNWRSNPVLILGMAGSLLAHLAALYVPAFYWLFYLEPINLEAWMLILSTAVTVVGVVEADKYLQRKREARS
ncbi:MAG: HAD-IC family P-type ATPase [Patescibacteria group bacterium]|nr:HAD-IC family P-type ATPase [Patescibacteria group bacterium]